MATLVGTQTNPVDMLCALMELDFDAIEAYDAAISRVEEPSTKQKLMEFRSDHERHTRDLGQIIRTLGKDPPKAADIKRVLTQGKVVIGNLAGDTGVLMAMKTNEEDTNTAYERAVDRKDLSDDIRRVLVNGLEDERRHRAWIVQRLSQS
jgi:uncharacterized protein (TIGR02284 family)